MLGRTLAGNLSSFALDFDDEDAVLAWFGSWERVLDAAKRTRIEWHQDKWRLHYMLPAKPPIGNKRIHIKDSQLEVRCEDQLLYAWPSINKSGNQYTPLGADKIVTLDELQLRSLESMIDSLSHDYISDENRREYIRWLEEEARLGEGEGRHNGLVILGTSYYYRYADDWLNITDDQRRAKLLEWNQKQNVPKPEKEHTAS